MPRNGDLLRMREHYGKLSKIKSDFMTESRRSTTAAEHSLSMSAAQCARAFCEGACYLAWVVLRRGFRRSLSEDRSHCCTARRCAVRFARVPSAKAPAFSHARVCSCRAVVDRGKVGLWCKPLLLRRTPSFDGFSATFDRKGPVQDWTNVHARQSLLGRKGTRALDLLLDCRVRLPLSRLSIRRGCACCVRQARAP